ncbi:MAG: carboxypeptidase regulatory-like domain-containing protein [Phaeodactylibacter sp.]|uniref:carboxypeptidase regulatory-like domain-containing protein n=1 Tax=Phaeodactylibacter sp. TaxID=1940289 RepID=UPI0032F08E56
MKLLLSALTAAFFLTAILPAQAQLGRANKDYELGAFNLAVRSYLELLEKRPANYEAMVKLADSYRYLNEMEESRSWFEKVIRDHRLEGEQLFQYAQVLKALGQYEKAEQWFLAYARANKDDQERGNHFAQSCRFARNQMGQSSPYLVSNEFINSNASDFAPAFYGDQVVFASSRNERQQPGASWTGRSNNQLYMARLGNNGFLEAEVPLQSRLREGFINLGPLGYSPSLQEVVYTKNSFIDGTRHIPNGGLELSMAMSPINQNGEWTEEKPFPYNGSGFSTGWPNISPDGNTLYFASDRPDGFGGFDIYVSYRMGNTWSAPENLGPVVNSPGDEISPFHDGDYLFFSSNYHQGMGGYDIFRAEQANGRYARIFHLGNLINSSRDDYGFIYDSFRNLGYLVSNRSGGRGHEDIYKVFKSADNIVLKIRNASDGTPIPYASIDFVNCGEGLFKADSRGQYSFQAVEGLDCEIVVRADGYSDAVFRVSTLGLRQNREHDIMLAKQGEQYTGQVLNYQSRMPVAGVQVTATNLSTKTSMEAQTDGNGEYALALSPNATYTVRYSRPGFRDISRNINTNDGFDRSILGIISILPIDSAPAAPYQPGIDTRPGTQADAPVDAEPTMSGFAVQVAALSKPGLEQFSKLTSIGQVYSKVENGVYKIRLGVFSTRPEADQALKAAKAEGYKEAFIVTEQGTGQSIRPKGYDAPGTGFTPKGDGTPQSYGQYPAAQVAETRPATGDYMIQLAAYQDARWFDPATVRDLGEIRQNQREDGLTVMYLSGYATMEQAIRAWQQVRSNGYNTAYVVRDTNGSLEKVYP